MDEVQRLLEIAKKVLTQNELDKLAKGKKTQVKLWPNFSIGFELEVAYTGESYYEVTDDDVEERFNDEWDDDEARDQIAEELSQRGIVDSIDEDDLAERLMEHQSFEDGMDVEDFIKAADKEYFIKPKYGWADPLFAMNLAGLVLMKRCLTDSLPPNIYNYYSILQEFSNPRSNQLSEALAATFNQTTQFSQRCSDLLVQYRDQRENYMAKITDEFMNGTLHKNATWVFRGAPAEPSFLTQIQELYDEYSKFTSFKDLLDLNTLNYFGTPQAEKYRAGVCNKNGNVFRLKRASLHIDQQHVFPHDDKHTRTDDVKQIHGLKSGREIFNLIGFFEPDEDDGSKPDWNNEASEEDVAAAVAGRCIDDVNSDYEAEYNQEYDELYEKHRDQLRDRIRRDLEIEGGGGEGDEDYNLREVENLFDGEDGIDRIYSDSSITPRGGEIVSVVFKGKDGLSEAMDWLERMFEIIEDNHYVLETNESTGLHINIGTFTKQMAGAVGGYPLFTEMDLFKLSVFLGEDYLLDIFNRHGNQYAGRVLDRLTQYAPLSDVLAMNNEQLGKLGLTKIRQKLQETMGETATKYSTVNFKKLTAENYIEFRAAGGEDYHKDFKKIKQTLARIILAVAASMDEEMFRQEYMKKIIQVLSDNYRARVNEEDVPKEIRKDYAKLDDDVKMYVNNVIKWPENSPRKIVYIQSLAEGGVWYQTKKQGKGLSPIVRAQAATIINRILMKISNEGERSRAYKAIKEGKNPNTDMRSVRLVLFGPSGRPNLYRNTRTVRPSK